MHRIRRPTHTLPTRRRPAPGPQPGQARGPYRMKTYRLPLNLLTSVSTPAERATDLYRLAGAVYPVLPCWGGILRRAARQLAEGLSAAAAVAAWTEVPAWTLTLTETAYAADPALSEPTFVEATPPLS